MQTGVLLKYLSVYMFLPLVPTTFNYLEVVEWMSSPLNKVTSGFLDPSFSDNRNSTWEAQRSFFFLRVTR